MNSSKVNYESTVIAFTQINSKAKPLTGYLGSTIVNICQNHWSQLKSSITISKMRTTTSSCSQANSTSFH